MRAKQAKARPKVDWAVLRQRLERAGKALAEGSALVLSAERREAILRERARRLAASPNSGKERRDGFLAVEFSLAGALYAVEARFVREVAVLGDYSPVPGAPAFCLGVAGLRGRMVSVVDLKSFFDLPGEGLSNRDKLVVLRDDEAGGMEFALLADEILGVRELAPDDLKPPPATFSGVRAEFTRAVAGGRVAVLDAGRVLSSQALAPFKAAPR